MPVSLTNNAWPIGRSTLRACPETAHRQELIPRRGNARKLWPPRDRLDRSRPAKRGPFHRTVSPSKFAVEEAVSPSSRVTMPGSRSSRNCVRRGSTIRRHATEFGGTTSCSGVPWLNDGTAWDEDVRRAAREFARSGALRARMATFSRAEFDGARRFRCRLDESNSGGSRRDAVLLENARRSLSGGNYRSGIFRSQSERVVDR